MTTRTRQICRMMSGSAKSSGFSPWNAPFDATFATVIAVVVAGPPPWLSLPAGGGKPRGRSYDHRIVRSTRTTTWMDH